MFFSSLITNIREGDKVLEVGPGANPHPRSDVFLELRFEDDNERINQYGHRRPLRTEKPVVFYDGESFPFADREFDYVICSHVMEHVPDVQAFASELFRVARRGYVEYPLAYYELLYNVKAHLNLLKRVGDTLHFMPKCDTALAEFKPLQRLLAETFERGHTKLVDDLPDLFIEGFEWDKPFACCRVRSLAEVCHRTYRIPERKETPLDYYGGKSLAMHLGKVLLRRLALK